MFIEKARGLRTRNVEIRIDNKFKLRLSGCTLQPVMKNDLKICILRGASSYESPVRVVSLKECNKVLEVV